ncbi:hypothetical protein [Actinoplanes sichuanensis]|uniref:Uncharacterized protein n=1 Tax=Actinoplanes sichuanensis TaxID=512349 RepID=A0ABW4A4N4_9ACTN|nr:hypothetical protein [Actinoplanes sichuanensis]
MSRQVGAAVLAAGLVLAVVVAPASPASAAALGPVSNTFVGVSDPSVSQPASLDSATRTAFQSASLTWNTTDCRVTQTELLAFTIHGYPQYQHTVWVTCTGEPFYLPDTMMLNRYISNGEHLSTTWRTFRATYEGDLGRLHSTQRPGTVALYQCASGSRDTFTSSDVNCEGQRYGTRLGFIHQTPPASVAAKRLYRCLAGAEHFDSNDSNCEGQRVEGLLGYTLA